MRVVIEYSSLARYIANSRGIGEVMCRSSIRFSSVDVSQPSQDRLRWAVSAFSQAFLYVAAFLPSRVRRLIIRSPPSPQFTAVLPRKGCVLREACGGAMSSRDAGRAWRRITGRL